MNLLILRPPSGLDTASFVSHVENRHRLTFNIQRSLLPARGSCVAVIVDEDSVVAVGLINIGKVTGHYEIQAELRSISVIHSASIRALVHGVPTGYRRHLAAKMKSGGLLTPIGARHLVSAFRDVVPDLHSAVIELSQREADAESWASGQNFDQIEERDALLLVADFFRGMPGRKRMSDAIPLVNDESRLLSAHSKLLIKMSERDAVEQDAAAFLPDGFRKKLGPIIKMQDNYGSLAAFIVDRTSMESTHGVDLVYHIPDEDRFILVQYKRMSSTDGSSWTYRPNKKFYEQLRLMKEKIAEWDLRPKRAKDYRLKADPFFYKFVNDSVSPGHEDGLLPGLYLSRRHLILTLKDKECQGVNGGKVVGWNHCAHHLTNTEMVKLFRAGWIGTHGAASADVRQAIESCFGSATFIYAQEKPRIISKLAIKRDFKGRFTEGIDPLDIPF